MARPIFVFGSNLAGVHGAGAARTAYQEHGALWGQGYGPSGHSWAIPTKDESIKTMRLEDILTYVDGFLADAANHPALTYKVTRIGCGLAGLYDNDMAPMFVGATSNVYFDEKWHAALNWADRKGHYNFWGTYG